MAKYKLLKHFDKVVPGSIFEPNDSIGNCILYLYKSVDEGKYFIHEQALINNPDWFEKQPDDTKISNLELEQNRITDTWLYSFESNNAIPVDKYQQIMKSIECMLNDSK